MLSDPFIKQETNVEVSNLLTDNQFGFRSKRSPDSAVHHVTKFIVDDLDKNLHHTGIFLDLAKVIMIPFSV